MTDTEAMKLAIQIARFGVAHVSPNPLVGCVILDDQGRFLSAGYHQKVGEAHAEINALKNLELSKSGSTQSLSGATVFVTLEPCAHEGRTPSCAKHLAKLSIKKVVYGLQDPNPLVAGQGAEILRQSGKLVELYDGSLKTELEELPEVFLCNFQKKRPFVALKVASSLDGHMAMKSGESKWITGEESRTFVHELRSRYDAVLVGQGTLFADDPQLNVRHPHIQKKNKVIILERDLAVTNKLKNGHRFRCLDDRNREDIFIFNNVEPKQVLDAAWSKGIKSIFVEGGARVYSSFLQANCVDRIHSFVSPKILGGVSGLNWTSGVHIQSLSEAPALRNLSYRQFGVDMYLTGRLN